MREYQLAHDVLDMERTVQALQRIINDSKARFSPEDIAFYRDAWAKARKLAERLGGTVVSIPQVPEPRR